MKLIVYYLNKVGLAADLQSMVSLVFFMLFLFILYIVIKGNRKEYDAYGEFPLEEDTIAEKIDSQEKI
mgnify:CR=1 FL=1